MKLLKKHWFIIVCLAIGILGIGYWKWRDGRKPHTQTYMVERKPIRQTLSVSGSLVPDKQAQLAFGAGGRIAWLGVEKGQRVRKWQAVASLDQRTLQKQLEKELNDYLKTRWDFQGTRETYNVTSDDLDRYTLSPAARRVLDKAQFDLNNSVLDVEIQAVAKEFSVLLSPIDGIVTEVSIPGHGTNVGAGVPLIAIVDDRSLYFEAHIDELDIGMVSPSQSVEITLDAYPNDPITSTISEIGFSPIALSGGGIGYAIRIELPEESRHGAYKPGMNGDAVITIKESESTLVLSSDALIRREGKSLVMIVEGNLIKDVEVTTGIESESDVEITGGLHEGEIVVVRKK